MQKFLYLIMMHKLHYDSSDVIDFNDLDLSLKVPC